MSGHPMASGDGSFSCWHSLPIRGNEAPTIHHMHAASSKFRKILFWKFQHMSCHFFPRKMNVMFKKVILLLYKKVTLEKKIINLYRHLLQHVDYDTFIETKCIASQCRCGSRKVICLLICCIAWNSPTLSLYSSSLEFSCGILLISMKKDKCFCRSKIDLVRLTNMPMDYYWMHVTLTL